MQDWLASVPAEDRALAAAVLVALVVALATRHRGGRFRALPGWAVHQAGLALLLVLLSRVESDWPYVALGLAMFVGLRTHFFLAPLRPRDRGALAAAYIAVPCVLYPGLTGSAERFLATVPIILVLLFPVLVAAGRQEPGLLDSLGRILLGVLLYVFCAAHVALIARQFGGGLLELFGVLLIAAELPQRLGGRFKPGGGSWRPLAGLAAGAALAVGAGFVVGPWVGLVEEDAARAGALVALAVSAGLVVNEAVLRDLGVSPGAIFAGRGAILDRTLPVLYAAPVFFHYVHHFA